MTQQTVKYHQKKLSSANPIKDVVDEMNAMIEAGWLIKHIQYDNDYRCFVVVYETEEMKLNE